MHSATKGSTSEGNKVGNKKRCAEGTTERKSNGNKVKNEHTTRAKPTTGTWEPPRGPASLEKTLTEVALVDPGRRHLDNRGGRPPCGVGGLRRGALPCNISLALEDTEPANLGEIHTSSYASE